MAVALARRPCSRTGGTRDGTHGSIDGFAAVRVGADGLADGHAGVLAAGRAWSGAYRGSAVVGQPSCTREHGRAFVFDNDDAVHYGDDFDF